jgi:FAD/FMN-containing dehydrogenase
MMAVAELDAKRLEALSRTFSGKLLQPGGSGYDEARKVHNGLIDKQPALIARCLGAADVAEAVRLGRESGLEISVRGGGHNVGGRAVTDGGLMIDLAEMKGIHVDPETRSARAQGGVIWRELDRETAVHGLATTGGQISTTGIAGYTLGGGLGWLMSKFGLAADNVLSVELVTADALVVNVTEESHPDLFWAVRGGGGNFGIAASLEYRLHPLSTVYGGLIAHPFEAARDVFRAFREFTATATDDASAAAAVVHSPDGSGVKLAALLVFHTGSMAEAETEIRPLLEFGSPLITQVGPMPYPVMNTLLDPGYPKGALSYWKSSFLESLDDEFIELVVDAFAATPSIMNAIIVEFFHGAVTRIAVTDTPVPHREVSYNVLLPTEWLDPADTDKNISWTRETFAALEPHFASRRWLNYFSDDDAGDATRAAYGPNYDRLVEVKRRYDPDNVFHLNQNIDPGAR